MCEAYDRFQKGNLMLKPVIAAAAVFAIALLTSWSCQGSETVAPEGAPQLPGPVAGGHPPSYEQPVQVTDGKYVSPAGLAESKAVAGEAIADEDSKEKFKGVVSGIRLYPFGDADVMDYCGTDDFIGFRESKRLTFGYLPPGTFAETPQYEAVCPDGSAAGFGQEFVGYNFFFEVWYVSGEPAFPHDASTDRISTSTVKGETAVVIRPVTDDGVGSSALIVATPKGAFSVSGHDAPLEEITKIAEGISCEEC